jgi:hypothetical protein
VRVPEQAPDGAREVLWLIRNQQVLTVSHVQTLNPHISGNDGTSARQSLDEFILHTCSHAERTDEDVTSSVFAGQIIREPA